MTREDIIRMALESTSCVKTDHNGFRLIADGLDIERFAALVAAHEREACAKVCEKAIASIWEFSPEDVKQTGTNVCNNLAAAIRARGQA
jgi:hypothetical protein